MVPSTRRNLEGSNTHPDLVAAQLVAITTRIDSIVSQLKSDFAEIKEAWMDKKLDQKAEADSTNKNENLFAITEHEAVDAVIVNDRGVQTLKEKAGGDNSSDDDDGSEHVFSVMLPGPYSEFQDQEGLSFQMGMDILPLNTEIEDLNQIPAVSNTHSRKNIELHTFHPYNKLQIELLWPHIKMIGQEQFGKQPRPPERVQRIDGAQHDIPNSARFHHFTIDPFKEHFNEWATLFFVTRLDGKSILRAGCYKRGDWVRMGRMSWGRPICC